VSSTCHFTGELEDAQLPSKRTFLPKTINFFDTQREIFESYLQVVYIHVYLYTCVNFNLLQAYFWFCTIVK